MVFVGRGAEHTQSSCHAKDSMLDKLEVNDC